MTISLPPLRLGIAGLGTVGTGVIDLLRRHETMIAMRAGRPIQLVAVSARDKTCARDVSWQGIEWVDDARNLAIHPDIDVVVEMIGGAEGIAREVCEAALLHGKHVVTANKALIAHHGAALAILAEQANVQLQCEAAVAGGIPVIKLLKEGLVANKYEKIIGILNGTCNYILSTMEQTGRQFDDVLAEAQALGYAEADPAFDIDGIDAGHKLCILSAMAFGTYPAIEAIFCEGIRHVSADDITAASTLGYTIRLIAVTQRVGDQVALRVHPALLPLGTPVSEVDGVYNAVHIFGDAVGDMFIEGKGAGRYPTASAIIADIVDIARGNTTHTFLSPTSLLVDPVITPIHLHRCAYYLRLSVVDHHGVLAAITQCFSQAGVSIARFIQHEKEAGGAVTLILTTHETQEQQIQTALSAIAALHDVLLSPPRMIRIEKD
jgi:homoserine dehydrogenase